MFRRVIAETEEWTSIGVLKSTRKLLEEYKKNGKHGSIDAAIINLLKTQK